MLVVAVENRLSCSWQSLRQSFGYRSVGAEECHKTAELAEAVLPDAGIVQVAQFLVPSEALRWPKLGGHPHQTAKPRRHPPRQCHHSFGIFPWHRRQLRSLFQETRRLHVGADGEPHLLQAGCCSRSGAKLVVQHRYHCKWRCCFALPKWHPASMQVVQALILSQGLRCCFVP